MKVISAKFVKSALKPADFPRNGLPEVVFAGRSNVGKSTLLNRLLRRKGLAKTSKKPGKTRAVNFFSVNDKIYLVDLPGYGFARVSQKLKETWGKMITAYILERSTLCLAIHLVDARHPPTSNDQELLALLGKAEVPTLVVATKWDKVKKSQQAASLKTIQQDLELDADALVLPVSSVTGEGIRELWKFIDEYTGQSQ